MELEGEWVMGWPDRKRARVMPSKDSEGRTIFARSPVLDLEGVLTPTDAYYVIAQLNMPDPVHPDDFSFTIGGMVDNPIEYTLEEIRKLPGRTVRAVTECAGNDGEFWDYIEEGKNVPKLRNVFSLFDIVPEFTIISCALSHGTHCAPWQLPNFFESVFNWVINHTTYCKREVIWVNWIRHIKLRDNIISVSWCKHSL